jgi:sugar lactone lactonase YvrE
MACEHASSQVSRTEPDGRITPLATHYQGKQLNSPNDIVCAADGGIYFSDPPYGLAEFYGVLRPQEFAFQGLFRVGPDPKSPVLLADDFDRPNGLCFSLDGRRMFATKTGTTSPCLTVGLTRNSTATDCRTYRRHCSFPSNPASCAFSTNIPHPATHPRFVSACRHSSPASEVG